VQFWAHKQFHPQHTKGRGSQGAAVVKQGFLLAYPVEMQDKLVLEGCDPVGSTRVYHTSRTCCQQRTGALHPSPS
jgi:hypothetical protein